MKKISLLIVLAMIVTIGGVYATWNYAQGQIESVDVTPTVTLTEKVVDTPMGAIAVDMSGVEIFIDDTNNDHKAELIVDGDIEITFTANDLAPADVKANGIAMEYTVAVTTPWEFNGTQIFTVSSEALDVNNGNATFTATIPAAELMNAITLADISLPTVADYDAFESVLANGEITITVGEAQ